MSGEIENKPPEKRKRGNPNWVRGVSGNPGGRPKEEREVVEAIQARGIELAEKLLKLAIEDENVVAIKEALDRGYGKAKQVVAVGGPDGGPVQFDLSKLTIEQLRLWRELVQLASPSDS